MNKKRWLGTWKLESCELQTAGGSTKYPYGKNATGYIMYLEKSRMAVIISGDNRKSFATDDLLGGTTDEKLAAFDSYISYCGTFEVGNETVIHHIDTSLFPNWVGTDQERIYRFEGDLLYLSTKPFLIQGEQQTAYLIWQRV
jgi:hypothetical protein